MNNIQEEYDRLSKSRDYHKMIELLNSSCDSYLSSMHLDYSLGVILIDLNIELLDTLGASKQYEMEFNLQSQLIRNRNRIFKRLLGTNAELVRVFDRIVGRAN